MPISRKLDYVILDMIESSQRTIRTAPMNLGGLPGSGGGIGTPPGGFIGWIPQTRVAYDLSELATTATPGSGQSLLDNLNHIRSRIEVLESGGTAGLITVIDDTSPVTYSGVDTIHFSGAVVVTDLGSGDIRVTVSGGTGGITQAAADTRYLKLDTSNDPLTDQLQIVNATAGNGGIYIQTEGDSYTADFEQYNSTQDSASSPVLFAYRENTNSKSNSAYLMDLWEATATSGVITGGILRVNSKGNERLIYNPNITASGDTSTFIDTNTVMSSAGKILSIRNSGTEKFYITGDGIVNIPSGQTYNINGVAHTHPSDGWIPDFNTWTYSSADSPTFVISINADVTALIGVGDRIKLTQTTAKYFIVTAVGAYSGGATLVTVYGGTDYTLVNAAITTPFYSHVKSPFGFPVAPDKWTVTYSNTSNASQASAVQNTWYNPSSQLLSVPIGAWKGYTQFGISSPTGLIEIQAALSTSTSSVSNSDYLAYLYTASNYQTDGYTINVLITETSKTTHYLIIRTLTTGSPTLNFLGGSYTTMIKLTSAYL